MKYSYRLLKQFAPGLPSIKKLADRLNLYAFEVEEAEGDLLDIKLPANRYSGAVGHIDVAREAAIIFGLKLKDPVRTLVNIPQGMGACSVRVEDPSLCPRYAARYFELKNVSQSPAEVKKILQTAGINSINSVVDLTNIVMLETGQPLHAFDADKIAIHARKQGLRELFVRRARKGEVFESLDKKRYTLAPDILVIADSEKVLAVAGIKGGLNSGVDHSTRRIILEAAHFDPAAIYRASRALNLQTDGSIRHAHNLSAALVDRGLDRATELLKKQGAKLLDSVDRYPKRETDKVIGFDLHRYERLIGQSVLVADAQRMFRMLGFEPTIIMKKGDARMRVRVPAWRNDVETFEDLADEVVRLCGIGDLPPQAPVIALGRVQDDDTILIKDRVRSFLHHRHLDEVYTHSFSGEHSKQAMERLHPVVFSSSAPWARVENPISKDKTHLRWSLQPRLLEVAEENGRFYDDVRIFEVGNVFSGDGQKFEERLSLGMVIARRKDERVILELKGIVADLLSSFGITDATVRDRGGYLEVSESGHLIAVIHLHPLEKGWIAAVGEVALSRLLRDVQEEIVFRELPRYPAVIRDMSLLLDAGVRIGEVIALIEKSDPLIVDVDMIDEYADPAFSGKQGITVRIVFQSPERTLNDEEVNRALESIAAGLIKAFSLIIR